MIHWLRLRSTKTKIDINLILFPLNGRIRGHNLLKRIDQRMFNTFHSHYLVN